MSSIKNQKKNAIERSTSNYESKLSNEQQQTKRTIITRVLANSGRGRKRKERQ